jgi:DNA-binding PadR family transcriptional regulator
MAALGSRSPNVNETSGDRVEVRAEGTVRLCSRTLYKGIGRLVHARLIREVDVPPDEPAWGGPPRPFYELTSEGRRGLPDEVRRMDEVVRLAKSRRILG